MVAARLIPAHAGKTRLTDPSRGAGSAHPRSRGENLPKPANVLGRIGSSPLTRGKRHGPVAVHAELRLIPAHAGKTSGGGGRIVHGGAHPRSRGENATRPPTLACRSGSSPLTRGKLAALFAAPASWSAHPRSRGENGTQEAHRHCCGGSSPLTRGKPRLRRPRRRTHGLIPAHAGKTASARASILTP